MTLEALLFAAMILVILSMMACELYYPDSLNRILLSIPQGP